jgi:hypothetical protein
LEGFYYKYKYIYEQQELTLKVIGSLPDIGDMEIMSQRLCLFCYMAGTTGDRDAIEFCFVHRGELYTNIDGTTINFKPGDSFYIKG